MTSNRNSQELIGMNIAEVVEACQWKLMSGRGKAKAQTGSTFLNCVTPKLYAATLDGSDINSVNQMYANFDNTEGSVGVAFAQALSMELLQTGTLVGKQYFFKLIDSKSLLTIATDMPEREVVESTVPEYLRTEVTDKPAYDPDVRYCAFFKVYAVRKGQPVLVASSDIDARFAPEVAVVGRLVKAGHHLQVSVAPQAKVEAWLESQKAPAPETVDLSEFNNEG